MKMIIERFDVLISIEFCDEGTQRDFVIDYEEDNTLSIYGKNNWVIFMGKVVGHPANEKKVFWR